MVSEKESGPQMVAYQNEQRKIVDHLLDLVDDLPYPKEQMVCPVSGNSILPTVAHEGATLVAILTDNLTNATVNAHLLEVNHRRGK